MKKNQWCLTMCVGISLVACGGNDDKQAISKQQTSNSVTVLTSGVSPQTNTSSSVALTLAQKVNQLEESGTLPKLDRGNNIKGPDTNNNGIRDDIDAYIAQLTISNEEKKAALQQAKAMQEVLLVDLTNAVAMRALDVKLERAAQCIEIKFKDFEQGIAMGRKIEAITANTQERSMQYIKYNNALSGTVSKLLTGNTCDE
jgi:hypothetical protein